MSQRMCNRSSSGRSSQGGEKRKLSAPVLVEGGVLPRRHLASADLCPRRGRERSLGEARESTRQHAGLILSYLQSDPLRRLSTISGTGSQRRSRSWVKRDSSCSTAAEPSVKFSDADEPDPGEDEEDEEDEEHDYSKAEFPPASPQHRRRHRKAAH